jgi:glucose-6-phosphate isomerase/transaldolase/glucose-6-phosphate isomerase
VIEVFVESALDLGREFWRFEFATAVAGYVLGIDPFDEPNVAEAKAATQAILEAGALADVPEGSVAELVAQIRAHDYFAVLCYTPYGDDMEAAANRLRARVRADHKVATTFGYGPRYLHSTGQLHKGGPNSGVFLIATTPPEDSEFGRLCLAQAVGDYETLREHDRRVARVTVTSAADLEGLLA